MAKKIMHKGEEWEVVSDDSIAHLTFIEVKNGEVVHTEAYKDGTPEEIHKYINGRKHKVRYAWNIKTLVREKMNKDKMVKERVTVPRQAEGIDGEGKLFNPEHGTIASDTPDGTSKVNKMKTEAKLAWKDMTTKAKMLVIAAYTGIVLAVGAAIIWVVGILRK